MQRFNTRAILLLICLVPLLLVSCGKNSQEGKLIITRIKTIPGKANFINGENWRFTEEAQIIAVSNDGSKAAPVVLTEGFYSACSPDISYDGNSMLFAGQVKKGDPWRIWQMDLKNLKSSAVSPEGGNCADPVYLPAGRFTFSRITDNDSLKAGFSIFTCNLDGSNLRRVTFNPATYFASNVLADGRILTAARTVYPDTGKQLLMVLRPDGTKNELFYNTPEGADIYSRCRETSDGKVIFIESATGNSEGGRPVSIDYSRPLHTKTLMAKEGDFLEVCQVKSGKYLASYRKSSSDLFSIVELDPQTGLTGNVVAEDKEWNLIDVNEDIVHTRPRKLPSEVDMKVKTGLLMCQDINFEVGSINDNEGKGPKVTRIELLGIDKSLGIVNAEEDGSFYLKPIADTPFRIRKLDKDGKVVGETCSWIYLRPNERRGCVGCHEDPEITPENRIPLSVKKKPVIVPVHIDNIKEKKVDLE